MTVRSIVSIFTANFHLDDLLLYASVILRCYTGLFGNVTFPYFAAMRQLHLLFNYKLKLNSTP